MIKHNAVIGRHKLSPVSHSEPSDMGVYTDTDEQFLMPIAHTHDWI